MTDPGEPTPCILPADLQRGGHGNEAMLDFLRIHVGEHCQHDWANSIAAGYNDLWDELQDEGEPGLILLGQLVDMTCELCDTAQRLHLERVKAEAERARKEREAGVQERLL